MGFLDGIKEWTKKQKMKELEDQGVFSSNYGGVDPEYRYALDSRDRARDDVWRDYNEAFGVIDNSYGAIEDNLGQGRDATMSVLDKAEQDANNQLYSGEWQSRISTLMGGQNAIDSYRSGLTGSEEALTTGANQSIDTYGQTLNRSLASLAGATDAATGALARTTNGAIDSSIGGYNDAMAKTLAGGEASSGIVQRAIGAIPGLTDPTKAIDAINTGVDGAVGELDFYSDMGERAANVEAALSGALGAAAQQQAINSFIESPGQAYLREQQEKALLRNSAAIGGLGGGNVRTALQEQAYGIAAQQQQQQVENLRAISQLGATASANQAQYRMQGGLAAGDVITNNQLAAASMYGDLSRVEADIMQQTGLSLAELAAQSGTTVAGLLQDLGRNQAGLMSDYGTGSANLISRAGENISGVQQGLGSGLSTLRTNAAGNIAGVEQNTGNNLANIITNYAGQRSSLATDMGKTKAGVQDMYNTNMFNALSNRTSTLANMNINRGTALANIEMGSGTNLSNLAIQGAEAKAAGIMGQANAMTNLLGQGVSLATLAMLA